jgi:hypothetical protein
MKSFDDFVNEKNIPKYKKRGMCIFPAEHPKVKEVDGMRKDHFPINDLKQARNALARVGQFKESPSWYDGDLESLKKAVKRGVKKHYPSIEINESVINESNMDYCRFRNTYGDLQDCYEHMDDKIDDWEEEEFKKRLIALCEDIAKEYGDIDS